MVTQTQTIPSIAELIEAQAARAPGAPAVIAAGRTLSYRELVAAADAVAAALVDRGVQRDRPVGVCVERDAALIPALLGVLRAGGAYIPIDPSFPAQRIRLMLEDARPSLVLASRGHAHLFEGGPGEVLMVEDLTGAPPPSERTRRFGAPELSTPPAPGDLAYIIYTSGSTGRPKGVMVEHRGLTNVLLSIHDMVGAGPQDRLLAVTTVSFDIAGLELFLPLLAGGTVVLAGHNEALDGRILARLIERHRINLMQATPATWRMLVDSGWTGSPGLRALVGGEALQRPLADALLGRVGALWNVYGPTETTVWSTAHRVTREDGAVPIGHALDNTTLQLLDEQRRPVGEGELCIGGMGVARGYLNREDLTRERFIDDPQNPGERLYRTGDLCRRRPDGALEFIGRLDHQVKVRGHRLELGEVEAVLAADPDVGEAIAGVRGEGEEKALVAYVTRRNGTLPTLANLRRRASERLPAYMLPTSLFVVESMPRTPAGKTDRAALAALQAERAEPEEESAGAPEPPEAAEDLDLVVLNVFREVLGRSSFRPQDDFFDSGGHSLLAFRAAQEIEQRTGRTVDVALIFEHPTVLALSRVLRERGGMAVPATAIDLQPRGDRAPLFCVCGVAVYLSLAKALAPRQPVSAIYVDTDLEVFHGDAAAAAPLTIESVAECYLGQIRQRRPHGPYRLVGFSMGGAVAFEIARRLIAEGEKVELVAMIDTLLADSVRLRPLAFLKHVVRRTVESGPAWALRGLMRCIRGMGAEYASAASGASTDPAARQRAQIEARGRAILLSYRPKPCPVEVLLFNGADRPRAPYLRYDETGGWSSVAQKGLTVRMIPGTHADLLACPEVAATIAHQIRDHLLPIDESTPRQAPARRGAPA